MAHAARDERIAAVVEFAGGVDPVTAEIATRWPPMLIIHGKLDRRVPVGYAEELEQIARPLSRRLETLYLPQEGHVLSGPGVAEALSRATRFFAETLRRAREPDVAHKTRR